jgi:short-subunit dehydrogenase
MTLRKTALVTGSSSGIGVDMARELAARGYDLVLVARRLERLEQLAQELRAQHRIACLVLPCDLADRQQLNGLMARADAWLSDGRALRVLVNNAGSGVWDYFEKQDAATSQRDIDLNITALTTLCHGFIPLARAPGESAHILNIASLAALVATPRFAVYSAGKSYVLRFSEILAYELRHSNIAVTCICPGGVMTEFMQHAGQTLKGETGMMQSADVARLAIEAMLRGDVVHVPGFLNKASALARFLPRALQLPVVERSMLVTVQDK